MKRKSVAAGSAVVLVIGGGAWLGPGSATATAAAPHVHWPTSATTASAASTIASANQAASTDGSQVLLLGAHTIRHANVDVGGDGFGPGDYFMFE